MKPPSAHLDHILGIVKRSEPNRAERSDWVVKSKLDILGGRGGGANCCKLCELIEEL